MNENKNYKTFSSIEHFVAGLNLLFNLFSDLVGIGKADCL